MAQHPEPHHSHRDRLARRLEAALEAGERYEQDYRDKFVKHWTVEFIDVLESFENLRKELGVDPTASLREFRAIVRPVLKRHHAVYIQTEGFRVVACFEAPEEAAETAIEIQHALKAQAEASEVVKPLIPSIGLNLGDVVYERSRLLECNTCNLAQRAQDRAGPGKIFLCDPIFQALKENPRYSTTFVGTRDLRNIPELQPIHELHWEDFHFQAELTVEKESIAEGHPETVTIFYSDVCESAKKFWLLGDRLANELIRHYHNFVQPVLEDHGCVFQESGGGDQVMAFFPVNRPDRAADAAIQIQRRLFHRNSLMPQRKQIRASIGLHIGDILRHGREITQTFDFQIAKGVQCSADADEILISSPVCKILAKEQRYKIKFVGTRDLAGVPDPQEIYRLLWTAP